MSLNISFADTPNFPSKFSLPPVDCFIFRNSILILSTFFIANIVLILPLSTLILYLGYQHWRKQRYIFTAAAANHSDIFTYHMVGMEMIGGFGGLLFCVGVNTSLPEMLICGVFMFFSTWCVKIHFHTLTCVERYMAVVHPVNYVGLKNKGGMRIRNISSGCVWLVCIVWGISMSQSNTSMSVNIYFIFVIIAFIVVCFCCISVLCALRRPGPGEMGRDREQVSEMKQRAFNTVVTIMGALWLCLGGILVCIALLQSQTLSDSDQCAVRASAVWFSLPSSLVLPLLYLHRAGKLPGCKH